MDLQPRSLIFVTGLSGAGKSVALNALEDYGYYCIDGLPVGLLPRLLEDGGLPTEARLLAFGIDVRNPARDLAELPGIIADLRRRGLTVTLLFLEASAEILSSRFRETHRPHPLLGQDGTHADALRREREVLGPLLESADLRLDTSRMHTHELVGTIRRRVIRIPTELTLQLTSFGYRNGLPPDTDWVFDVRCLPNPHWERPLRHRSGLEPEVAAFMARQPIADSLAEHIDAFLQAMLAHFEASNRKLLAVALGCTGGFHRSVYMAERLAAGFRRRNRQVLVLHRDLQPKGPPGRED